MTTTLRHGRGLGRRPISIIAALAVFMALTVGMAPRASAAIDIEIPITTQVHAPVGSETLLATAESGDLAGQQCSVSADAINQSSTHPNNDLVVASGSTSVVLEDVEGVSDGTIHADGTLTLGDNVTVTLVMGADHVFSAGITVLIDCDAVPGEASVSVSAGECVVDEQGAPLGSVDVAITPDSGATVTVYSDAAMQDVVTTFGGSGGSADLEPGTYYWDAAPGEGYELTGTTSGQFTIADCDGSVSVSSGDCAITPDGEIPGFVTVTIDPDSSATVTVYDASSSEVATFVSNGSSDLPPGTYSWAAVAAAGFELVGPVSGEFSVADCEEPPPPPPSPSADLEITKIDLVDPVVVDSDNTTALITYEVTVTNNGPDTASGVVVTDTLPASLTFVSASPGAGTCGHTAGVVTCDLGDLANGESVKITIVVRTEAVGEVSDPTPVNVVQVSSDTQDSNLENNSDSEQTEIVEVLDLEVLPFTGVDSGVMVYGSLMLLGAGLTLVLTSRRREDGI